MSTHDASLKFDTSTVSLSATGNGTDTADVAQEEGVTLHPEHVAAAAVCSFILVFGLFLNILILIIYSQERQLQTMVSNMYIISQSAADSILCAISLPLSLVYQSKVWRNLETDIKPSTCHFFIFSTFLCITGSILSGVVLTVNRCRATLSPLQYATRDQRKFAVGAIVGAWLTACVLAIVAAVTLSKPKCSYDAYDKPSLSPATTSAAPADASDEERSLKTTLLILSILICFLPVIATVVMDAVLLFYLTKKRTSFRLRVNPQRGDAGGPLAVSQTLAENHSEFEEQRPPLTKPPLNYVQGGSARSGRVASLKRINCCHVFATRRKNDVSADPFPVHLSPLHVTTITNGDTDEGRSTGVTPQSPTHPGDGTLPLSNGNNSSPVHFPAHSPRYKRGGGARGSIEATDLGKRWAPLQQISESNGVQGRHPNSIDRRQQRQSSRSLECGLNPNEVTPPPCCGPGRRSTRTSLTSRTSLHSTPTPRTSFDASLPSVFAPETKAGRKIQVGEINRGLDVSQTELKADDSHPREMARRQSRPRNSIVSLASQFAVASAAVPAAAYHADNGFLEPPPLAPLEPPRRHTLSDHILSSTFMLTTSIGTSDESNLKALQKSLPKGLQRMPTFSLSKEQRAARTVLIVLIGLLICWVPFFLTLLCHFNVPWPWGSSKSCPLSQRALDSLVWLGFIHPSIINPLVTFIFNHDFKEGTRRWKNKLLRKLCQRQ